MTQLDLARLAPVAVYTYTRHQHLVATLTALRANPLAAHTVLYVVSDGAKDDAAAPVVQRIRDFVDDLRGFREVVRVYRPHNLGLKLSPPKAEQAILSDHGRIINMEDDNLTSTNYLDFINAGLQRFEDDDRVYSIGGYCPPVPRPPQGDEADFWFYPWNISWGYGVWKRKHDRFHPLVNRYPDLARTGALRRQNRAGGLYVSDSLRRDFHGQKYFPDAVLCTNMFLHGMRCVLPVRSKVRNVGQDGSGQSSSLRTSKYDVALDDSGRRIFDLERESGHAGHYRQAAMALYNGSGLTRFARRAGWYHVLSQWRARLRK